MSFARLIAAGLLLASLCAVLPAPSLHQDRTASRRRGPLTPQQERRTFRIAPGMTIQLVACEPQVESPVAMTFDEYGRLWVVEMGDYPNGPKSGEPPAGRIVILRDLDGDGFFEHRSVFADRLLFANGLLRWRDGVIVTQAPNIIFLRDTNGDGKADRREVLFAGFAAENPQLRVSHPNLGIDTWVYVANGLRGGTVRAAGKPDAPAVSLSGMDFRFHPLTGRYEAITGMGQYGNTFDDWGRRFVCDNRHHLRHIVLPARYVRRNPYLAVSKVVEDISILDSGPLSSGGKIYPISKNWTTSNLHAGRFTAACGVYIYRSARLPKKYYGNAFTCDPTGNLVHREILTPKGTTFVSRPARKGVEFLASTDDWFRPVFLTDGPDGALYVVDMYRAVIEHPQFMPPELKNRPDLTLGKDRGRIWRIVPEKDARYRPAKKIPINDPARLVEMLGHGNAWQRITAQRLLQQNPQSRIGPLLEKAAATGDPRGRLHAVWLLHSRGELRPGLVARLLGDRHPRLREHAVRLAEPHLGKDPRITQAVLDRAKDGDARVRFQTALTLGEWDDDRILPALVQIAERGSDDVWTRYAVATAVPARAGKLLGLLLKRRDFSVKGGRELLRELASIIGARYQPGELKRAVNDLAQTDDLVKLDVLEGLAVGMQRRGKRLSVFASQIAKNDPTVAAKLDDLRKTVLRNATKPGSGEQRRVAIRLLAHFPDEEARTVLLRIYREDTDTDNRVAAVQSLAVMPGEEVTRIWLETWPRLTPALRQQVTAAMLRRNDRTQALLSAIREGKIKASDVDRTAKRRLLAHRNVDIRRTAARILAESVPESRRKVLARYAQALKLEGDPKRGREVFKKNCASCHRVAEIGQDVGPVISDTRTKTKSALLNDILNPNQAIDNNYLNYLVATKDGRVVSGIIATETASSLTLKRANGETDVILRNDIEEIRSSGVSLMPEGLEKDISIRDMADLIAFLKNWRYIEGGVPADSR